MNSRFSKSLPLWESRGLRFISSILVFLAVFFSNGRAAYAQNDKVTVDTKKSVSLVELFKMIEKSSDYLFQYKDGDVAGWTVNLSLKNASISSIMDKALSGTDLRYSIRQRYVIIEKKSDSAAKSSERTTITGTVTDMKGQPLPGVFVVQSGSKSNAATTDLDGKYQIVISGDRNISLSFSCLGFTSRTVSVSPGQAVVNCSLKEDSTLLDEVVVVGYGVQKKLNLTGSVASTSGEVLSDRPIGNIAQGLQGVIPNLNITFNSGKPSQEAKINIRGNTSLNGGSALILLDGVEISDLSLVNPQDVESISVLKDASAAAVYGARAAFGVMLITTKKGASNKKATVNYNNNLSWNTPARLPEMPNSLDWARAWNKAFDYDSPGNYYFSDKFMRYLELHVTDPEHNPGVLVDTEGIQDGRNTPSNPGWAYVSNTDWLRAFYRNSGFMHQHNLSVSGGTEKVKYYASFGYKGQQGIFRYGNDKYYRMNANVSLDFKLAKWIDLGVTARMNNIKNDDPNVDFKNNSGYTLYYEVYRMFPTSPVFLPNGDWACMSGYHTNFNVVGKMALAGRRIEQTWDQWYTARLDIHPVKGLSIKGDVSYNSYFRKVKSHGKTFYQVHPEGREPELIGSPNNVTNEHYNNNYLALNLWAEYKHTWNEMHNFSAMAGYNQEGKDYYGNTLTMNGLYDNNLPVTDMATDYLKNTEIGTLWRVQGVFYRLNYDYDSRYLLELNGRYDGSSKYHKNDRWAFFPSGSLGWNIAREKFVTDNTSAIDELKLRYSMGMLGNQVTSGYHDYMSIIESAPIKDYVYDGKLGDALKTPTIPSFVTWEKVITYDFGLDWGFLGNRLTGSFDAYIRDTKGMVRSVTLPAVFGTSSGKKNLSDMRTVGWEFNIGWRDRINNLAGSPFDYSIGVGISDYQATITKHDNPSGLLKDYYVGQKLGEIWGFETQGFIMDEAEADEMGVVQKFLSAKWHPGDIRYRDLDGNGKIDTGMNTLDDPGDRRIIGNSTPRYKFNITGGIGWHGFALDFMFDGVCKRDVWIGSDLFWGFGRGIYNSCVTQYHIDNSWTEENPNAYFPRLSNGNGKSQYVQTKYLQNAAFLRLKNLTLSYTLPRKALDKLGIENARIYATGMNVFEITGLPPFMTPDITDNIVDSKEFGSPNAGKEYAFMRSWSFGINVTF